MTIANKQVFSGLFFLLFAKLSFAQTELAGIQASLAAYTKTQLPEKLFVHTDKTFYTAGEIMWFKIYNVDGISHKPLAANKVAYVELLDRTNTPVSRTKVLLNEKGGDGSIELPLSLRSGYYTVRTYTNWMKNLGADHFFEKTITVVNPLKSPEPQQENQQPAYVLQLFPEGGNLVSGLSSRIAFHITDKWGKGLQGKGYLLNAKNDTISSFVPYKFGMGHFDLTPQSGINYKVVFALSDGQTIAQTLPTSHDTGYTMQVEDAGNDKIKITAKTNTRSGFPEIYLLAQTRQIVKAIQKNVVADGTAIFMVDKKALGEGVSQFTVFDSEKKPVCERLFFLPPSAKKELVLQPSKATYGTREQVNLAFATPLTGQENMSLSVYQLDELQADEAIDIQEYLWLTSELNGVIEQPEYYFSSAGEEVKKAADYLMLTHGWRRFKWEPALHTSAMLQFPRERLGHIITGRVTDVRTNAVAKGIQVFLSVPGSKQKLFTALSNSNGIVQLEVKEYFGQGEIIAQTNPLHDSFYKVDILSPFAEMYTNRIAPGLALSPSQQTSLINRSVGMQTQYLYLADSIRRFYQPAVTDTFPFYGRPLYSYNLDEYVRFNTMEEVLREYVREIAVGAKGSGPSLRFKLFNESVQEMFSDNLLVMADGIPLFNPSSVFSLNPLKIKKLDVITKNYVFGPAIFQGLANFSSYNGHYEGLVLDPRAVTVDYEGLQLQREFYSPDYSSAAQHKSRLPDLRTTLFWLPNVNAKQINFYTGDNKGNFLLVVQGIDADGQTISGTSRIQVK